MITLCNACGTSYQVDNARPQRCKICDDERQFVPVTGQQWVARDALLATHSNKWKQHTPDIFSIRTVPDFAIGQRAFLLRTPQGNILWDCVATLDDATKTLIAALGGLMAIAISHPHFYTTMQDWAAAFNAPVYLHASDREWIMRDSPFIRLWEGDELTLAEDIRVIRLGGHFAGGCVLHDARGDGLLLTGDILQVTPGAKSVSFMWSYPNMLPLPAATVSAMTDRLRGVSFSTLWGAFEGREITADASERVRRSGEKYVACLNRAD
ncbi:MBL fold metallo-hydrolase [Cronobacter sakazakii]|uniref:MBL fold metallo-hydrolase n=1 Tax=Cronobacter sakazakii TaxID=28141 RepID=UPI000BE7AC16|nr:MBL fold metallo-hydrolase [Cronobacter sakazakii]EKC6209748.1 MBL fold metallo-hydrolase [Cronobacter sakazakii]EKD3164634.1 MBL fold metallo-hydrolase [Cronobacter sakazakii]EKD3184027.1 MBL fold metallo-hydrolase [Cronobacter sakazakii]EKD3193427.1 MBL fold metallo-hydrolase [Cronobacter sakazakii]EKD3202626.1 MBL fold metallo-hydrolase [Cronobacter sakazakii]